MTGRAKRGRDQSPNELHARERALVSAMSTNLRAKMRALFEENMASQRPAVDQDEWDRMPLEQRSSAIASKAAFLSSDGAKSQFLAFAKIKANVEDARMKVQAGDGDAVLGALKRMEEIADICLELFQRADSLSGGWPAATIFERLAETTDGNKGKYDRLWKTAVGEAEAKKAKIAESKKSSFKTSFKPNYARGGGFRGNYSFRSVLFSFYPLAPFLLCIYLDPAIHAFPVF